MLAELIDRTIATVKLARNKLFLYRMVGYLKQQKRTPKIHHFNLTREPDQKVSLRPLIILHLYYTEMAEEFATRLAKINHTFDLVITLTQESETAISQFNSIHHCQNLKVLITENKGRDIFPFVAALKQLDLSSYNAICKIHSKKSPQLETGDAWRNTILDRLLTTEAVAKIENILNFDKHFGLIGPQESLLFSKACYYNSEWTYKFLKKLNYQFNEIPFFAGTMFWINPKIAPQIIDFETRHFHYSNPSHYQPDRLPEHAMERIFTPIALSLEHNLYVI